MSLINEALKKARVEAAQRDAERRGVLVPKAAALEPRRRGGSAVTWALAVVAALGLAATGGMWLARRGVVPLDPPEAAAMDGVEARGAGAAAGAPEGGDGGPETAAVPEAVAPETGSDRAAAPVAIDPPPAVADAPRPAPADPDPAPPEGTDPAPAAGTAAGSEAGSEAPPPPARPSASADPPAPAPRKRPAAAPTAAEGYLREAPLPAGGSIRLDGIVWSEATPAAVIEGQIVGPGEYVRGARIVRVERQRVVLEADGVELVIRLR